MEKRTILAFVLIFLVFVTAQFVFPSKKRPAVTKTEQTTPQPVATTAAPAAPASPVALIPDSLITPAMPETTLVLQNSHVRLELSSRGAVISKVELADYQGPDGNNVSLLPTDGTLGGISSGSVSWDQLPFNYQPVDSTGTLCPANLARGYTFYYGSQAQPLLTKTFILGDEYFTRLTVTPGAGFTAADYALKMEAGINDTEVQPKSSVGSFFRNLFSFGGHSGKNPQRETDYRVQAQFGGEVKRLTLRQLEDNNFSVIDGASEWIALRSMYFLQGVIPDKKVVTTAIKASRCNNSPGYRLEVPAKAGNPDDYRLYLGPVQYKRLQAIGQGFENNAELGWGMIIRPIARFFIWVFSWLHRFIPNYGLVIILFALLLKLALTPLTRQTFESSRKMQKVQPLLNEINRKYKDDPQMRMQEMQRVYREHGANPLGGCLPLLLQMPIFFALYPMLRYSIELRAQGFFGWINDLSQPDPYWILPIVMAILMFVQQKMFTPTPPATADMDEKQQAALQSQKLMLYIMPVFMFFIFKSLPSGLVLYWLFFNVFSFVQQYLHQNSKKG